jgi:hypothetical protein
MALLLGPMPASVRTAVQRLIAADRRHPPHADERLNGLLLTGGPGGCSYLDADGEVWNRFFWSEHESVEHVPDGPLKVGLVAIAAERLPALAEWLPRRPSRAVDCAVCNATGWLQPPNPPVQCPKCHGMGWLPG